MMGQFLIWERFDKKGADVLRCEMHQKHVAQLCWNFTLWDSSVVPCLRIEYMFYLYWTGYVSIVNAIRWALDRTV
jgi:hypothetical protein